MLEHFDHVGPKITGHVFIKDKDTGEVLLDKRNAIHYENMSVAIARALAGSPEGTIQEMHFGSGGSAVSGTGAITYFPPNVTGPNADLYNPTYFKAVGVRRNADPAKNYIEVRHLVNTVYTDIIVTCTLDYSEPSGQDAFDDSTNLDGTYVFDELGLKSYEEVAGQGNLLTHVVFNPIQKSLNRLIEVVYTLRIQMA